MQLDAKLFDQAHEDVQVECLVCLAAPDHNLLDEVVKVESCGGLESLLLPACEDELIDCLRNVQSLSKAHYKVFGFDNSRFHIAEAARLV